MLEHGRIGETYNIGGRNERTNLHVVKDHLRPARSIAAVAARFAASADLFRRRSARP